MKERWKDIEKWEGFYQVSNLGRVRSLDRYVPWGKHSKTFYKGRILKTDRKLSKGYQVAVLVAGRKRKRISTIHRLVAETFISNPSNYPLVRHLDNDINNNCSKNLAWGTMQDNYRDRVCWNCGVRLHRRSK